MVPPDFPKEFQNMKRKGKLSSRKRRKTIRRSTSYLKKPIGPAKQVGVYYFGPETIGDRLHSMCETFTDDDMEFIYHHRFAPKYVSTATVSEEAGVDENDQ